MVRTSIRHKNFRIDLERTRKGNAVVLLRTLDGEQIAKASLLNDDKPSARFRLEWERELPHAREELFHTTPMEIEIFPDDKLSRSAAVQKMLGELATILKDYADEHTRHQSIH